MLGARGTKRPRTGDGQPDCQQQFKRDGGGGSQTQQQPINTNQPGGRRGRPQLLLNTRGPLGPEFA